MINDSILGVAAAVLWVAVTPATVTEKVPEYFYSGDSVGSVQSKAKLNEKPVALCQLYENGVLVGVSFGMDCK